MKARRRKNVSVEEFIKKQLPFDYEPLNTLKSIFNYLQEK